MYTLYTVLGHYRISEVNNEEKYIVTKNGQEYYLDIFESIVWTSLFHNILNFDELESIFYKKEKELHVLGEGFEYYHNRLIQRGLIRSGSGYTGIDALNNLIDDLHINSTSSLLSKTITFIHLTLIRKVPFHKVRKLLKAGKITRFEKQILKQIRKRAFIITELKEIFNSGVYQNQNITAVVSKLYLKKLVYFTE